MPEKEYKIYEQDKFLAENRKKFNKEGVDNEALQAKKTTVNAITKDMTGMPDKLHVMGPLSKTSARPAKSGENPLQGGEAEEFSED